MTYAPLTQNDIAEHIRDAIVCVREDDHPDGVFVNVGEIAADLDEAFTQNWNDMAEEAEAEVNREIAGIATLLVAMGRAGDALLHGVDNFDTQRWRKARNAALARILEIIE